jgi:ankyrin repeat protein
MTMNKVLISLLALMVLIVVSEGVLWADDAQNLCNAAGKGELSGVKAMLDKNPALINCHETRLFTTPLINAVAQGHREVVTLLLKRGADVNAVAVLKRTPLHFAKTPQVADLLITAGARINAKDEMGQTPLHLAAEHSNKGVMELLLRRGADPSIKDNKGRTAARVAASMEVGRMTSSIMMGRLEMVKQMLDRNPGVINERNDSGNTALHAAASWNKETDIVKLLISRGASTNIKNDRGRTPLHEANNTEIAGILLAHGAKINTRDNKGVSPLGAALERKNTAVAEFLRARGGIKYL